MLTLSIAIEKMHMIDQRELGVVTQRCTIVQEPTGLMVVT